MKYKSLAISFRIQLGFHAANNEGAGGTNVMEPRRITVGDKEYDGISGEIVRHHVLERFVALCQSNGVPLHQRCQGLVPDRGREPLKNWINTKKNNLLTKPVQDKSYPLLDPPHYPEATKSLISQCAVCDIGGYLLALETSDNALGTLKRDSCFEIGWLITEHPAVVNYAQHSAYDPDPKKHKPFVQNMRIGTYGGVLRIDLDRIGFNDWWWLGQKASDSEKQQEQQQVQPAGQDMNKYAISDDERAKRIWLLLEAIRQWLLSPTFAKQAGWLHHPDGTFEGAIVLSTDGPAPFYSPIKFELEGGDPNRPVIKPNPGYRQILRDLAAKCGNTLEVKEFNNPAEFKEKMNESIGNFQRQAARQESASTNQAQGEGHAP